MELIDRRKLVSDFWNGVEDCSILSYEDTDDLIENAPTVDAVEVVRCKDCKNRPCNRVCKIFKRQMGDDCYCFYGERKRQ